MMGSKQRAAEKFVIAWMNADSAETTAAVLGLRSAQRALRVANKLRRLGVRLPLKPLRRRIRKFLSTMFHHN